jgi:glycosyltransferase involved in cell wall biosynthesis
VIVVTWNTRDVTADVLTTVRELSPPETTILVVDNGSTDGTRAMLMGRPDIETLMLHSNAGHGIALDLAVCATATTVAVTLDSDAIPLRAGWLDQVVRPIRAGDAVLAGLRSSRDFVHPVFSAVDTATFIQRDLSYQAFIPPGIDGSSADWGVDAWDTGELLTRRVPADRVLLVDPTPNPVDGLPGMTTGGVVYHHGGVSRGADGTPTDQVVAGWRDAIRRLRQAVAAEGPGVSAP